MIYILIISDFEVWSYLNLVLSFLILLQIHFHYPRQLFHVLLFFISTWYVLLTVSEARRSDFAYFLSSGSVRTVK